MLDLLKEMFKDVLQGALEAELDEHLSYEKNDKAGKRTENHRNGYFPKTVKSELGPIELQIPRDRNGEYGSQGHGDHRGKSVTVTAQAGTKVLIAVFAVVGVLLIGVIVLLVTLLMKKDAPPALPVAEPGVGNAVVDDGFDREALEQEAQEMFNIDMTNAWTFPDGESPSSDAYIANSRSNKLPFYFEIVLPGSKEGSADEVLYKSPVVPVGSAVREVTLNRDLDAGQYECVCLYYVLNSDNTVKSTINVVLHISIEA